MEPGRERETERGEKGEMKERERERERERKKKRGIRGKKTPSPHLSPLEKKKRNEKKKTTLKTVTPTGNLNERSATGVCFTRSPATGEKKLFGEFLVNAQGSFFS